MVDWDRVEELRAKNLSWSEISEDPKVGFHPDASAGDPGRALRALYHRNRSRAGRKTPEPSTTKRESGRQKTPRLLRFGYLAVPFVAIWFALAYLAPSPVGLLVPALPYLGLVLAGVAFVLVWGLWRIRQGRWSPALRTTVIGGVILGLVFAGMVGLVGALVFGCPYLPPASTLSAVPGGSGWNTGSVPTWQEDGKPVLYFYGATWCPYCSASSWAIWKALTEFGAVTGASTGYSSPTDVYPQTPEMVLANAQFVNPSSAPIAWVVSEYSGGTDGTPPSTSSCVEQAYVTAYSGGSIPFLVVDGKYIHSGASLISPTNWQNLSGSGAGKLQTAVTSQSGWEWPLVEVPATWIMALLAKAITDSSGTPFGTLASEHGWTGSVYNLTYEYYQETP
jgi:hypothetical protein